MLFTIKNIRLLTIFLSSMILLSSCEKDEDFIAGFLNNGSVEMGTGTPDDWFLSTGNNSYDVVWTDEDSYSGDNSLRISTGTQNSSDFAFWAQSFNSDIPFGESVTLSVWIKGELTGNGVSIAIRGDDTETIQGSAEQFVSTQGASSITGNFDWTQYSITLDSIDADIKILTVYLIFLTETTGTVYFDDIQLQ